MKWGENEVSDRTELRLFGMAKDGGGWWIEVDELCETGELNENLSR